MSIFPQARPSDQEALPYPQQSVNLPGFAGYGAAKAALERFTQGLAEEVKDDNIAVTSLAPSIFVSTAGAVFHRGARYIGDENGEPPEWMARATLLLATEPPEKVNGMVTYSQKLLLEYGVIEQGGRLGYGATRQRLQPDLGALSPAPARRPNPSSSFLRSMPRTPIRGQESRGWGG